LDFQNNNPYDDDGNLKVKSKDLWQINCG
jgi:hypothetical protein